MSIIDKIRQVNPRQEKSVKSTPVSEGGLGLSPSPNTGSGDVIKKTQQNVRAKYWYDKYKELVGEVAYQQEQQGQNFKKLEEKVDVINEGLLDEEESTDNSDPLTPLDQKFVTFNQLAEHYRTMITRLQQQIATIGGGGIGDVVDDPSPQLGGNLDTNGKDVTFTGATSNLTWDASANDLEFDDNSRLKLGTGDDFQIWHGGTHTFMKNNTGELRIRGDIISLERENDLEKYLECNVNEDVKLFYNGNEKFATTNTGIGVTGNVVISDDGNIGSSSDTDAIAIASDGQVTVSQGLTVSGNLDISDTIYHTGDSNTKIRFPSVDTISFHTSGNEQMSIDSSGNITASQNLTVTGATTHNNDVTFTGDAANVVWDKSDDRLEFADNARAIFGNASGGDLRLFHEGGHSTIKNVTGQFRIAGNDIRIQTQNQNEVYILCTDGGAVTLYYNGNAKLATTNTGVTVTGDAKVGTSQSAGVILTSPDGTEYRLIVANGGALSTSAV